MQKDSEKNRNSSSKESSLVDGFNKQKDYPLKQIEHPNKLAKQIETIVIDQEESVVTFKKRLNQHIKDNTRLPNLTHKPINHTDPISQKIQSTNLRQKKLKKVQSFKPPYVPKDYPNAIKRVPYSISSQKHYFNYKKPSSQILNSIDWASSQIGYFDIQTNGKSPQQAVDFKITTIVLFDGTNIKYYVHGKNLHEFKKDIQVFKVIVTFSGTEFDLKHTQNILQVDWSNFVHIDLFYQLEDFGYHKGLKNIMKMSSIQNQFVNSLRGDAMPKIWRQYQKGNQSYLKLQLVYNVQDVLPLRYLARMFNFKRLQKEGLANEDDRDVDYIILKKIKESNRKILENFIYQQGLNAEMIAKLISKID